jgi:imidazolonepropionase-like amidohydrolase
LWATAREGASQKNYAMTPVEALRASTILAAEKLGLAPDLGSIKVGKLADFFCALPMKAH